MASPQDLILGLSQRGGINTSTVPPGPVPGSPPVGGVPAQGPAAQPRPQPQPQAGAPAAARGSVLGSLNQQQAAVVQAAISDPLIIQAIMEVAQQIGSEVQGRQSVNRQLFGGF